jgi:hypothetical protein
LSSSYAPSTAHEVWVATPLLPGDWRDLPLAEALPLILRALVRIGRPKLVNLFMNCWPTRVRAMRPTFYPGWVLAEVQAALPDSTIGLCNFLYGETGVLMLDGTSPPIHALNATGALKIDDTERAADYLRFFCTAIHGEEGRFMMVERAADAYGRGHRAAGRETPPESALSQAAPLSLQAIENGYRGTALLRYGVHLFHVHLQLSPAGMVEMTDDEPVADLDMQPEVFRPPFWVVPTRSRSGANPPDDSRKVDDGSVQT